MVICYRIFRSNKPLKSKTNRHCVLQYYWTKQTNTLKKSNKPLPGRSRMALIRNEVDIVYHEFKPRNFKMHKLGVYIYIKC